MSYQVEEVVVPVLAHVVGSGITVDCGIMYVTSSAYSTETCSAPGAFTEPMQRPHYWPEDMSYQVEEIVVPALAHVVGSGITVDCGIMYVPNDWWKHRWATY
jgi:hypothetical protein